MLNLKFIQENKETVIERLAVKNFDAREPIEKIIELDNLRKSLQQEAEAKQAQMNVIAKQIGRIMQSGQKEEAEKARQETAELKASIADNVIVKVTEHIPQKHENDVPHWELTKKYDLIDFETGVKITGAGFPLYKGLGAKLQRALINFFLEENIKAGYQEVQPPLMVNEASGYGTGQLPDKDGQMYYVNEDNLYLIPTAEVPVTNIYRDMIVEGEKLPIKNTAYSACFRREAGSYGKDVRGLNRLHQFDKVEIVQITRPELSYEALDDMVKHVENLLIKLELPYRIVRLCGGDISFTSALTYDFEVYSKAQEKWLEVSSVSNFEEFQANRLKLRFKDKGDKKTTTCHTLNGSSLALPRIVAALLENNQCAEGIRLPEVLQAFMGREMIN